MQLFAFLRRTPKLEPLRAARGSLQVAVKFPTQYVAASQTDAQLGSTGAVGDFIHRLIIIVTTAATSQVSIKDGDGTTRVIFPNSPGPGVGTYPIEINAEAVNTGSAGWKITTGAGVAVLAVGDFT